VKKFYLIWVTLLIVLSVSGCSGDKPSDVAVEFVEKMSNLNISEAKQLSASDRNIKSLEKACVKAKAKELAQEAYEIFKSDTLFKGIGGSIAFKAFQAIGVEVPYSVEDFEKMSQNEREIARKEMFKGMSESEIKLKMDEVRVKMEDKAFIKDAIKESLDSLEIAGNNSNEIKELFIEMFLSDTLNRRSFSRNGVKLATEILLQQEDTIDETCLSKYTSFANVDDINIIESKNHSADEVTVRLEIINEDKKSEKVSIELEKIQDEWKITNPSFNISMWDL
jgi:hypothetical protein